MMLLASWVIGDTQEGAWVSTAFNKPECFIDNGISWLYVRGFMSNGNIDPYARDTLIGTQELRLDRRIYIDPNMRMSPKTIASKLCNEVIKGLDEQFHVYISALYDPYSWSQDVTLNRKYIEELRNAITAETSCFKSVNILSRKFDWEKLFGKDYTEFSRKVLIWDKTDGNTCDKSKFAAFGGWKKPDGIVYKHNTVLCDIKCDVSCLFM